MKKYIALGIAALLGLTVLVVVADEPLSLEDRVATLEALHGIDRSTPTATEVPPTATDEPSAFFDGWHGPMAHDGLNIHEHGQEPPQWVMDSGFAPVFPEGPEAHQGHKFVCDAMPNGVESCIDVHILATGADTDGDGFSDVGARSVPFHSYQLWIRDPEGGISYWDGLLDFSPGGGNPAPLRTSDTGERPIILSVNDAGCETWYSDPNNQPNIGWTVCGRHTSFDGTVRGGDGTFRTADWIIIASELPFSDPVQLSPALADYCQVQFGVCRFTFLSNSVDFGNADPVN